MVVFPLNPKSTDCQLGAESRIAEGASNHALFAMECASINLPTLLAGGSICWIAMSRFRRLFRGGSVLFRSLPRFWVV